VSWGTGAFFFASNLAWFFDFDSILGADGVARFSNPGVLSAEHNSVNDFLNRTVATALLSTR
jgi:hypothetical protein